MIEVNENEVEGPWPHFLECMIEFYLGIDEKLDKEYIMDDVKNMKKWNPAEIT